MLLSFSQLVLPKIHVILCICGSNDPVDCQTLSVCSFYVSQTAHHGQAGIVSHVYLMHACEQLRHRADHRTAGSSVRNKLKPFIRNVSSAIFVQLNTHLWWLWCLHNEHLKIRSCLQLPFNSQRRTEAPPIISWKTTKFVMSWAAVCVCDILWSIPQCLHFAE